MNSCPSYAPNNPLTSLIKLSWILSPAYVQSGGSPIQAYDSATGKADARRHLSHAKANAPRITYLPLERT